MGLIRNLRASQATPPAEAALPAASAHEHAAPPNTKPARPTYDRAEEGTKAFIKHVENGECHWQQPAARVAEWPMNGTSDKPYHGFNTVVLALRGYEDPRWCTFEQAAGNGWRVRQGEKATPIFFWKVFEKDTGKVDADGEPVTRKFPLLCRFNVFNFNQLNGPPPHVPRVMSDSEARKIADPIVDAIGVDVREANGPPGYNADEDAIYVRPRIAYSSEKHYCADLMNGVLAVSAKEAITRLSLPDPSEMTDKQRAQRDLRIELARTMLSMRTGLPMSAPEAIRDAPLLELLAEDKREIFRAAKDAEQIARYALAFNPEILHVLEEEHRDQMNAATTAGAPETVFDANDFDFWPDDLQRDRPKP